MKKLESNLINMTLSLGLITVSAGLALSAVYSVTEIPIAQAETKAKTEAISNVLPQFDNDPIADMTEVKIADIDGVFKIDPSFLNGEMTGAAVESFSHDGFSGTIVIIFGFSNDGDIIDYRVLQHAETPGLGEKMGQWFKDETGSRSIIGRNMLNDDLRVTKDGGEIDGITAATITSRAFLGSLDNAYKALQIYIQQQNHEIH